MNSFLKVLTIASVFTLLNVGAQASTLTCKSLDKKATATIELHEYGFINKVTVKAKGLNSVVFDADIATDMTIGSFTVKESDINANGFLKSMKINTQLSSINYSTVDLQTVIPSGPAPLDLFQTADYIADDGAGIALISFKNSNNKLLGASILVGWAGLFTNCK